MGRTTWWGQTSCTLIIIEPPVSCSDGVFYVATGGIRGNSRTGGNTNLDDVVVVVLRTEESVVFLLPILSMMLYFVKKRIKTTCRR
jgi:hypothetical protein